MKKPQPLSVAPERAAPHLHELPAGEAPLRADLDHCIFPLSAVPEGAGTYVARFPIAQLIPWKGNPRKLTSERKLQELAQDIRQHGLLQPIVVRHDGGNLTIGVDATASGWIVAGERRFRAAKLAGLTHVPILYRGQMSDEEASVLAAVENGCREDVHPLDEAASYAVLIERGWQPADIAAKVSKPEKHVRQVLLLHGLADPVRSSLYEGRILLGVALEIARITDHALQAKALDALEVEDGEDPVGLARARDQLRHRLLLPLAKAPFAIDDPDLVLGAGTCTACPKQTAAQKTLFDEASNDSYCLDGKCWDKKNAAFVQRERAAAKDSGRAIIEGKAAADLFPYGINSMSIRSSEYVDLRDSLPSGRGSYGKSLAKYLTKNPAASALVVVSPGKRRGSGEDDPGGVVPVMRRKDFVVACQECKAPLPYWAQERGKKSDSEKERAARQRTITKVVLQAKTKIVSAIQKATAPVLDGKTTAPTQLALRAVFKTIASMLWRRKGMQAPTAVGIGGVTPPSRWDWNERGGKTRNPELLAVEKSLDALSLSQLLSLVLGLAIELECEFVGRSDLNIKDIDGRFQQICSALGIDLEALQAELLREVKDKQPAKKSPAAAKSKASNTKKPSPRTKAKAKPQKAKGQ